ncbi:MAG: ImmA/IrrE family metallo-endopeptidase [Erysipelotrichaceae bacterium]
MSEIITADNLDKVIEINSRIEKKISEQALMYRLAVSNIKASSIVQTAIMSLQSYGLIMCPVEDKYLSGAIYVKDNKTIPFINTALPRVNQYFTAWHEMYHILFDQVSFNHLIETDCIMEERKADYFAACMLLDGVSEYFGRLDGLDFLSKVFYCMSMYQAPYKSVLISLYEHANKNNNEALKEEIKHYFDAEFIDLTERFKSLGLDESLVEPSYVINSSYLKKKIEESMKENPDLEYHKANYDFYNKITSQMALFVKEIKK